MDGERRCQQVKTDGSPCNARPLPGSDFCPFHDPDVAERRQQGRQRGGRHRKTAVAVHRVIHPIARASRPQDSAEIPEQKSLPWSSRHKPDWRIKLQIGGGPCAQQRN